MSDNNKMTVQKEKKAHEPLFHVVKRDAMPWWKSSIIRVVAVLLGLVLCAVLSKILIDANPGEFIEALIDATFGSDRRKWKFMKDAAVLLCIALAITPAFKMRFWNIGAEGQVLMGALCSVGVVMAYGGKVPDWQLLILMFLSAVAGGALWGGIPAVFKAFWGTNETLFTLMMNYTSSGIVAYFLVKWTPSGSSVLGELQHGHLPKIFAFSKYPDYLLIIVAVLVITAFVFIYQNFTKHGYEVAVVGESENTAKYIGINVKKVIIRTMLISGAICGIAGFLIVAGLDHSITETTVGGRGFTAIMVSWLAKFNPIVMIGTAAFVTFLDQGASQISTTFRIDSSFPDMVVGIILFFIIGCEFFINYKLKFRSASKKEVQ